MALDVATITIPTSDYDAFDALLHTIYERTCTDNWFKPVTDSVTTGVCIRVGNSKDGQTGPQFRVFPYETPQLVDFVENVRKLNPAVAVKLRSASVHALLRRLPAEESSILIDSQTRIQVLSDIEMLPNAEKDQCGAFIREDLSLILWSWSSSPEDIIPLCHDFEEKLIKYIWRTRGAPNRFSRPTSSFISDNVATSGVFINSHSSNHSLSLSAPAHFSDVYEASMFDASQNPSVVWDMSSNIPPPYTPGTPASYLDRSSRNGTYFSHSVTTSIASKGMTEASSSKAPLEASKENTPTSGDNPKFSPARAQKTKKKNWLSWWKLDSPLPPQSDDPEKGGRKEKRKLVLLGPFYAGCGAALAGYFSSSGISVLLREYRLDGDYTRFVLLVTLPVIFAVSIFFCLQLVGNLSLIFGPVAQCHENSAFYSAVKPDPNPEVDNNLPHITIQCPVYKESLESTIAPSVFSIKKAMQTYARQGGTSSIFICDDGLQLISEKDRQERMDFYANHNIGWVARPGHNTKEAGGFLRAGKFKKASNMNYGLALSIKLEKHLAKLIEQGEEDDPLTGECLEDRALALAIEQTYNESGRKPWAANGKSLRVGEIILIIDADTVVPEDCFRDAAREMYESPDVAIIQHESDVMQVAHHYFENGITHFTRRINKCISYGCANGEVAPFVGHNAFLRWSAVQDVSFVDEDDANYGPNSFHGKALLAEGKELPVMRKQWSESNVSEDFDLALRLLLNGYTLRWATYSNGGFKEGVSLTVVDELNRWQKYAYGCDEIIFNPLIRWWRKGPISEQLRGFVWSAAPVHYKIGMMSYMFSYYGIAAAMFGSILNYLLLAFAPQLDQYYLHSFEILLACAVVFPGLGNLGFTLLEYRLGHRKLYDAMWENARWFFFFFFFFGGLSIHLSTAILAHLFSYDMTWGSTGKEVEKSTFWIEVPRIFKRFWLSFLICLAAILMMVILTTNAIPFVWQVPGWNWALIIPLSLVIGCHIMLPIVLNPWLMKFSY